jgi:hypothetical protein
VAQASSLCGQRASSPLIPQFNKVELKAKQGLLFARNGNNNGNIHFINVTDGF